MGLTATEWAIARRAWAARAKGYTGADVVHRACNGSAGGGATGEEVDVLIWRYRAAVTNSAPLD